MILPYGPHAPQINPDALVVPNATVIGQVILERDCSVWFGAVLRGDNDLISVGQGSNIQDGCVVHVDDGKPCRIGRDCVIGHQATLHGCTLGDRVLIGIGARVLNDAVVEDEVLVAAGALVPEGARLESGYLYMGCPARQKRKLTANEIERIRHGAAHYRAKIEPYRKLF